MASIRKSGNNWLQKLSRTVVDSFGDGQDSPRTVEMTQCLPACVMFLEIQLFLEMNSIWRFQSFLLFWFSSAWLQRDWESVSLVMP